MTNAASVQDMHATHAHMQQHLRVDSLQRMTSLKLDAPLTHIIPDMLSLCLFLSVSLVSREALVVLGHWNKRKVNRCGKKDTT